MSLCHCRVMAQNLADFAQHLEICMCKLEITCCPFLPTLWACLEWFFKTIFLHKIVKSQILTAQKNPLLEWLVFNCISYGILLFHFLFRLVNTKPKSLLRH